MFVKFLLFVKILTEYRWKGLCSMISNIWRNLNYYIEQKKFILILIAINLLGSIYGFYWYKNQLLSTSTKWLIFVPDSPMASSFFTIFLILYYFNKKSPIIDALAAVTSFKYGIWATAVILWGAWAEYPSLIRMITLDTISWTDIMLMTSHLGMALEALIFFRKYSFGFLSIFIVGIWTLTNDYIDYTQDVHPWLPNSLASIDFVVGEYTLYLSGFTLLLFYFLYLLRIKNE